MGSMAEDIVMDTTIHEPSMTAGEVDMGLVDCWEIDLPFCAGELAEALLRCAELTEQTYPTQSQAPGQPVPGAVDGLDQGGPLVVDGLGLLAGGGGWLVGGADAAGGGLMWPKPATVVRMV
jgi:hypothetical protein